MVRNCGGLGEVQEEEWHKGWRMKNNNDDLIFSNFYISIAGHDIITFRCYKQSI